MAIDNKIVLHRLRGNHSVYTIVSEESGWELIDAWEFAVARSSGDTSKWCDKLQEDWWTERRYCSRADTHTVAAGHTL